ncbi:hypothetical protein [Ensifer soli]|uniref:hypothetical protein n=1 Tax=Ciceribacter sp. sgz301302 TaxID=3342379 RepID=UPI0035B71E2C
MVANSARNSLKGNDSHSTIQYVRQILGELRTVTEGQGADMLAYLIEMAYVEASDILAGHRPLSRPLNKRDPSA